MWLNGNSHTIQSHSMASASTLGLLTVQASPTQSPHPVSSWPLGLALGPVNALGPRARATGLRVLRQVDRQRLDVGLPAGGPWSASAHWSSV